MDYLNEANIVYRIFNEVQIAPKKHDQYAEIFAALYCHIPESFISQFSNCVYILLPKKGSSKDVDMLIRFISTAVSRCIGNNATPALGPLFIQDLLCYTKTKDRLVRLHCLQIINEILTKSKEMELEEKTIKKLKQVYMERSRDKVIAVRSVAATGLCLLQNPLDPDEPIIQLISQNLQFEPVFSIRILYAERILIHPLTVNSILSRLHDDEVLVRLSILRNLREHSLIQQLPINLRHAIIHSLQDRNEIIIHETESLIINNWCAKNSLIYILSLFDIEEEEAVGELFLHAVFTYEQKQQNFIFTEKVPISVSSLLPLSSFFLYSVIRFLFESRREMEIDRFISDTPTFCQCLNDAMKSKDTDKSVVRNMTRCLQYIEISDEICKNEVLNLIRNVLAIPAGIRLDLIIVFEHVHVLLQALLNLLNTEASFLSEVSLILSDLEESVEESERIGLLMLFLVQSAFQLVSTTAFRMPEIQAFFERVVRQYLQSPFAELRREAVKGLVLSGIMRREVAFQYTSLLLCMVLEEDEDVQVQIVAINGLIDFILVYGDMKHNASQDIELGVSIEEVIESLNLYIFSTNELIQNVTCQAFCKLFIFDKIRSVHVLSNLILLLFDSSTEKRTLLRQVLAIFFPTYCNPELDKNCLFFKEAVLYTIKGIAEAGIPDRFSMLNQMSKFFLTLMTVSVKKSEKRVFVTSDDEEEVEEEVKRRTDNEYNRSVYPFLEKLVEISESRLEDVAFMKEIVSVLSFVDSDLMNRLHRVGFNAILLKLNQTIPNQSLKRILKAKNKVMCTLDPSLEKI